ncbi:MAG: hypothetical protein WCG87_03470 [Bacteroidota bacterium]
MDENKKPTDFLSPKFTKLFEEQEKLYEERRKTIKRGDNVVHLQYIGELNEIELQEINNILAAVELELSSYNTSGFLYNSIDDYRFITSIALSYPIITSLLTGLAPNIIWDTIKYIIIHIWRKNKGKKYNRLFGGTIEEKEITFGLHVNLDQYTSFDFELKGDVSDKAIVDSLDKVLDFLRERELYKKPHIPDYVYYDLANKKWVKVDVFEEIIKKANNNSHSE